tara:strand:- start:207 stop:1211 length:1005 start_codon:yes stop_codon:yes gene_type:complete
MKITRQKMIMLCYAILASVMMFGQAPANDCGEDYLVIDQCGVDFSVTQAEMGNATEDEFCDVGGSCPIIYVNGVGYENFDCNTGTGVNSSGDDFNGSVENSLWWGFVPAEDCSYTVDINITNCCCKDKGSSNSAQYQIFHADAPLPGGTILGNYAYNTGVTGAYSETFTVTAGETVYIMLDGLNGTDCDIDVSITPGSDCTGCNLVLATNMWDFDTEFNKGSVDIVWGSEDLVDVNIERSPDGRNWTTLNNQIKNTSEASFIMTDDNPNKGYNYYRGTINGDQATRTRVVYNELINSKLVRIVDLRGVEVSNVESFNGMLIYIYEDGTIKKVIK